MSSWSSWSGSALNPDFGPGFEFHMEARFEAGDASNPNAHVHTLECGRRQFGETRVGGHEAREAVGAGGDHVEAAAHVLLPVVGAIFAAENSCRDFRRRFDRRERIIQLVAEDANQALPGLALFVAQRAAQIGEHEQLVRQAAFAKTAATHFPTAGFARKSDLLDARGLAVRHSARPSSPAFRAEQMFLGLIENAFAGAIHEAERAATIEGENGHVNFLHHLAQQRGGFERASRCSRSVSPSAFTSRITSPSASSMLAPRARMEKSPSRKAASKLESVCSGNTTRLCAAKAKLSHAEDHQTVSVHWSFGE